MALSGSQKTRIGVGGSGLAYSDFTAKGVVVAVAPLLPISNETGINILDLQGLPDSDLKKTILEI